MKKSKSLFVCIIAISAIVAAIAGCLEGPEGPSGPVGPKGDSGETGPMGTAGCVQCHSNDETILAISLQWENSEHFTGSRFEKNSANCAACHTSQGFKQALIAGTADAPNAVNNPAPPNCRTCHKIHENYDTTDYQLRISAPVTIHLTGDTVDFGKGSICASCHQPMTSCSVPEAGETVNVHSSYWGPHHGTQAALLQGVAGYEVPGSMAYKNAQHKDMVENGCVTCHMSSAHGVVAGGHQMGLSYQSRGEEKNLIESCKECHTEIENFDYLGSRKAVAVLMDSLRTLLMAGGAMDSTAHAVKGDYPADVAGALWNYLLVAEDGSYGVHNTDYAKALLQNSIEKLNEYK